MKTMKAFAGVVSLSMLLLGGCSKKDDVLGAMQKMADKACACKGEAKCLEGLKAEGDKMKASMSKEAVEKMSDADKKKAAEIGQKMMECVLKGAGGGEPKKPE